DRLFAPVTSSPQLIEGIPTWDGSFRRRLASIPRMTRIITLALRGVTLPFLSETCPESIERFSGDIQCSNPVGIRLVAASCAFKPALSLAVVAGNIPAPRTGLGSLLRVDVDYGHPGKGGLIS